MTESHWELGHILSIGTSGGRWHLPREHDPHRGLCGTVGACKPAELPHALRMEDWPDAPMCRTCQHIRSSK
jgi:hypothetical protein